MSSCNTGAVTACVLSHRASMSAAELKKQDAIASLGIGATPSDRLRARFHLKRGATWSEGLDHAPPAPRPLPPPEEEPRSSSKQSRYSQRSSSKQSRHSGRKSEAGSETKSVVSVSRADVVCVLSETRKEEASSPARDSQNGEGQDPQTADSTPRNGRRLDSCFASGSTKELAAGGNLASRVLDSTMFDMLMGVVIVANSVSIGMEQTRRLRGEDTAFIQAAEHVFLSIYICEIIFRVYVKGFIVAFMDNWVKFDLVLVLVGVASTWVLVPLAGSSDELGFLMMLRTLRLLRLARALRLFVQFRELWMLVSGLLGSLRTMAYTLLLLFVMLYIFSCISMEIIANHPLAAIETDGGDTAFRELVEANFRSIPTAMLTFIQFICFDNIVYIYKPLIEADYKLALFFVAVIIIMSIALMNLVTAVIVNSALEQAIQDKDLLKAEDNAKRKRLVREMRKIFMRLDVDGSGEVSREEILNISEEDKKLLSSLMSLGDPLEIFDALDIDGSGDIGIDEFIDGIWQVVISNTPIEMKRMEKQVESMRKQLSEAQAWQGEVGALLAAVLAEVRGHKLDQRQDPWHPAAAAGEGSKAAAGGPDEQQGSPRRAEGGVLRDEKREGLVPPWADQLLHELRAIRFEDLQRHVDGVRVAIERSALHLEINAPSLSASRPSRGTEGAAGGARVRRGSTSPCTPLHSRRSHDPRLQELLELPPLSASRGRGPADARGVGGPVSLPPTRPVQVSLGEHAPGPEVPRCKQPILLAPERAAPKRFGSRSSTFDFDSRPGLEVC